MPLLLVSTALLACSPGGASARSAFIQDVLVEDNRIWLTRDPELVARKFEAMAEDRYDFMRGTIALHFADIGRPDPDRTPSRFLQDADATSVLLVGDPHPENATLCHPEPGRPGAPSLEFVDLDAAGFGPWTLDARRAALGVQVLARTLSGCGAGCQDRAVGAFARAYAARIEDPAGAGPVEGAVVDELIDRAEERGLERQRIRHVTTTTPAGSQGFVHDDRTRLEPLDREESAILDGALGAWMDSPIAPPRMRVLDRARRFGSGISSQPALRFVVLWDTGGPTAEDDRLLQIREVVDAPPAPGRALDQTALFDDNAERVEYAARTLWSRVDADPWASGLRSGGVDLKSVSWMDWLQPIDHDAIAEEWDEGDLDARDLAELAATLGDVLAASHARGETASGSPAGPVIRRDLGAGGGAPALAAELGTQAREDAVRLERDHMLFVDLLDSEGPLLGAGRILSGPR